MANASQPLAPLDVRIRLAALWMTTMLVVAFVDIFAYYRADLRSQVEAGQVFGIDIGELFMIGIVVYVILPTMMIVLSLMLPRRSNRVVNVVIAVTFAVTIVGAAIGEWGYYLLASAVELGLLAVIVTLAVKWTVPRLHTAPESLTRATA